VAHHGDGDTEIISSITSTSIRKISLVYRPPALGPSWRDVNWGAFNEPLCRLADRLGSARELEVDILIIDAGGMNMDIDPGAIVSSLAGFREKGRIRVVHVGRDESARVVYPFGPGSPTSVC